MMIMRPQALFDPCGSDVWEPVMYWDDGCGQARYPGCNWRTPQAWVTHTTEAIVTSVNVHEPTSNDHYDPLLRAAERVLA